MISIYSNKQVQVIKGKGDNQLEFRGLSTDTKPTTYNNEDIPNGAIYICIDTGDFYMWDAENKQWNKL